MALYNALTMPGMLGLAQQAPMDRPAYDPVTLEQMLKTLPQIEKRQRRAAKLRGEEKAFQGMAARQGRGNYVPTQHGGLYQTVGRYRTDYGALGDQLVGAIGGAYTGRKAETEEEDLANMRNQQILGTVEQIGQTRRNKGPAGGPTEATMRAYLGLIGGPDVKDIIGDSKVRSTQKLANGNLGLVTDTGIEDTGMPYDYGIQVVTGAGGKQIGIGKSGAGRGQATDVTYGAPAGTAPPVPGAPTVNLDSLTPEQNAALGPIMAAMPPEQQEQFISMIESRSRTVDQTGAPYAPAAAPTGPVPGTPLTIPTKAQEAGEAEAAKIAAQVAAAGQVAQAEGMTAEQQQLGKMRAEIAQRLPGARSSVNQLVTAVQELKSDPALPRILGGTIMGGLGALEEKGKVNRIAKGIQSYLDPEAANTMAKYENVAGKVYKEAFDTLKGGGPITEKETAAVADAYARLQRTQDPTLFQQALDDLIANAQAGLAKLESYGISPAGASGGLAPPPVAPTARPALPPGFSWED